MEKTRLVLVGSLLACLFGPMSALAQSACPKGNATIPPQANTADPSAPFFIDTRGLDLTTSPPTRDPKNPNYPGATELPDGTLPNPGQDGNYIIGATHAAAAETKAQAGVSKGTVITMTMSSTDSVLYKPAMVRQDDGNCLNASVYGAETAPGDTSNLNVTTAHPGTWTRKVDVYVPAQYQKGSAAPFIVFGDGGPTGFFKEPQFFAVLDNLIAQHRLPPMIAIGIGAGGQDAQGSERGLEYDAVSGTYAEWVEAEVLPLVAQQAGVELTKDPEGRATMGISSSGAAAFSMAWFHPELYHRVLAYSPTMVNQQWPHNPALPGGAWEYHDTWAGPKPTSVLNANGVTVTTSDTPAGSPLIPNSPTKPIRFWFETGDRDLFYPVTPMPDGMHDWTLADERMAKVLADKGYHYQFLFARNAGHVDAATVAQTLPEALEWLWAGYAAP
ncbi:MAG: alpha/beta hydrolase [Janthinobacterium lividum]